LIKYGAVQAIPDIQEEEDDIADDNIRIFMELWSPELLFGEENDDQTTPLHSIRSLLDLLCHFARTQQPYELLLSVRPWGQLSMPIRDLPTSSKPDNLMTLCCIWKPRLEGDRHRVQKALPVA
jgi:hypothetical protein